jgi:hypothetical protein
MLWETVSKYRNKLCDQLDLKFKVKKLLSDIQFSKPAKLHKAAH